MVCITQASHAGVFTLSPEEANTQLATDSSTHSKLTSAGHNFRRGLVKVIQHVGRLDLAAERHKAKIFLVIFYMVALRAFHVFMLWYSPAAAGRIGLPLRLVSCVTCFVLLLSVCPFTASRCVFELLLLWWCVTGNWLSTQHTHTLSHTLTAGHTLCQHPVPLAFVHQAGGQHDEMGINPVRHLNCRGGSPAVLHVHPPE